MTDTSTASAGSVPLAPRAWPLLGHALPLLRDPLAFIMSLSGYREMVRVRLGPSSAVMICDPDLTRQVFLNDRTFDKGGPIYDRIREVIGDGLSTCAYPCTGGSAGCASPRSTRAASPVTARCSRGRPRPRRAPGGTATSSMSPRR